MFGLEYFAREHLERLHASGLSWLFKLLRLLRLCNDTLLRIIESVSKCLCLSFIKPFFNMEEKFGNCC